MYHSKGNAITEARQLEQIYSSFGKDIEQAINDAMVTDIMLNADGKVWVERVGSPMVYLCSLDRTKALGAILGIARWYDTLCTPANPILSCRLPRDGSRFEASIPPVDENPTFSIRKKSSIVFSLADYEKNGVVSTNARARLERAVSDHENILIAGSTGSGKTTFANAILAEIVRVNPDERLFILEDTPEIQCSAENKQCKATTRGVELADLLRSALRSRPDRIIIGEVRGKVAWYLLKAWNTGHPGGLCTLHANAQPEKTKQYDAALKRLEQLVLEHPECPTTNVIREVIAETIHLIVYIARTDRGDRKVTGLVEISGLQKNSNEYQYQLNSIPL